MTCPRCAGWVVVEETTDGSRDLVCVPCGWRRYGYRGVLVELDGDMEASALVDVGGLWER